jgi:hypothetical protein
MQDPTTVAIIVERDGAARILMLAERVHVWALDTPGNRVAAQAVWSKRLKHDHKLSMTLFSLDDAPADKAVAGQLESIDLHHGEYSQESPWCRAEVFGCSLTGRTRSEFRRFGFDGFEAVEGGFSVQRPDRPAT